MKKVISLFMFIYCVNSYAKMDEETFIRTSPWYHLLNSVDGKVFVRAIRNKNRTNFRLWIKVQSNNGKYCDKFMEPENLYHCEKARDNTSFIHIGEYDFNCKSLTWRSFATTDYNSKNEVIDKTTKTSKWETIFPDTIFDGIAKNICPKLE